MGFVCSSAQGQLMKAPLAAVAAPAAPTNCGVLAPPSDRKRPRISGGPQLLDQATGRIGIAAEENGVRPGGHDGGDGRPVIRSRQVDAAIEYILSPVDQGLGPNRTRYRLAVGAGVVDDCHPFGSEVLDQKVGVCGAFRVVVHHHAVEVGPVGASQIRGASRRAHDRDPGRLQDRLG